ncbi:MAG: hypothetical protein J1F60_03085 [Oscillospiraceae bacterium]|nr:hypothetical protein [Oscillospiraceae bacterium]
MIKLVLIILYIVAFGGSAVLFFFYGRKNGLKGGIAVITAAAVAFVASILLAPVIASGIAGIQPIAQLIDGAAGSLSALDGEMLKEMLTDAAARVLEIPLAVLLYIVIFVIAFIVARAVMKSVKPKAAEAEASDGKSKSELIGAALGAAAPILVAVLTLFVSKVNLFNESDTVDRMLDLTSKSEDEILSEILNDPDSYTKILFETTLTGFDEGQRLELVNRSIKGTFSGAGDDLLTECFDFAGYSGRSECEADIKALIALYNVFDGVDPFDGGDLAHKILSVSDKDAVAENLYCLSFKDGIIRYVISCAVQDMTDREDYIYPKDSQIQGTHEDFAAIMVATEKYEKGDISQLDLITELKSSPLMPAELFEELSQEIIEEIRDEILDKLNEELEGDFDEERFEELYDELYDEYSEELSEIPDKERLEEIYNDLYDRLYGELDS